MKFQDYILVSRVFQEVIDLIHKKYSKSTDAMLTTLNNALKGNDYPAYLGINSQYAIYLMCKDELVYPPLITT